MGEKQRKTKKILLGIFAGAVCFFGIGLYQTEPGMEKEPASQYETFQGHIYDESRLDLQDLQQLLQKWQGAAKQGETIRRMSPGWHYVIEKGHYGIRYYEQEDRYLIGWQFLERDGTRDWYYFDTETGMLVCDTILDGVVLSKTGYATAVTAKTEETLCMLSDSDHCREVLVSGTIEATAPIPVTTELSMVNLKEETACIKSGDAGERQNVSVLDVYGQGALTLGEGVQIHAGGNAGCGIRILGEGELNCYGTVGSSTEEPAKYAIAAFGEETKLTIQETAFITGAQTGIFSQGETILAGGEEEKETGSLFSAQARTITAKTTISGNSSHGITQSGGTLTMKGGTIYDNGTLGSSSATGSAGGGVYLKNKATMQMSNGVISANRASYGGGIYVSEGCRLTITGGTVGGTKAYTDRKENTVNSGNYSREHSLSAGGKKYSRGAGGGIYTEGDVYINGKNTVNISHNTSKGAGGAGGILIYGGTTRITGTVNINNNKALHSAGTDSSQVTEGDPNGEGAGIRVGYDSDKRTAECLINCKNDASYTETAGTVTIKNNQSSGDGGGIYVSKGKEIRLVVKGMTRIENNESLMSGGGGIKSLGGEIRIYDAVIAGNKAGQGSGGGILSAAETFVSDCKICNNVSDQTGGGVCFYASTVGTVGSGTINKSAIYNNRSGLGGAGIEVRNTASCVVQGNTGLYGNGTATPGIRCTSDATLALKECRIYNNGTYGVYNQGRATVKGDARIGYATYGSESDYKASQNGGGGLYNEGSFAVNKGNSLHVYGGSATGIVNRGSLSFQSGSQSSLLTCGAWAAIKNYGDISAEGEGREGAPVVDIKGSRTSCGIDNSGGTLKWNGQICGQYTVKENRVCEAETSGNIKTAILNQNKGSLTTCADSMYSSCETAIVNRSGCTAAAGGTVTGCSRYGLVNEGTLYVATVGTLSMDMDHIVGIKNSGTLYGEKASAYRCFLTGSGTGIENSGVCYLGAPVQIDSKEKQDRTDLYNRKDGVIYMTGGVYRNGKADGVYCETGSRFCMAENACVDESNCVFLEPEAVVEVNGVLKNDGTVAVLNTKEQGDRFPGRVVVTVTYPGGTGEKELYCADGSRRFELYYDQVEEGDPAFLFPGNRINTAEDQGITERDLYVSTCYPVRYLGGWEQITGAVHTDISMIQTPVSKYWMEDLVLDLTPPVLSGRFADRGWRFGYWQGDDQVIYTGSTEIYRENRSLDLTAFWLREQEYGLEAWLYDRSSWLRNQMSGSKKDETYRYFLAGDTGVITFSSLNLTEVKILWPATGSPEELKTYDKSGNQVTDETFAITMLTESLELPYENSTYRFQVPLGTPAGNYEVSVVGRDEDGLQRTLILTVTVGDESIATTIRTRIR